jgi:hypothetical protein
MALDIGRNLDYIVPVAADSSAGKLGDPTMKTFLSLIIALLVVGFVAGLVEDSWTSILGAQVMFIVFSLIGDLVSSRWNG